MGKLNTHSLVYCIKYNWENWPNRRPTSVLEYLQIGLQNDDDEVVWRLHSNERYTIQLSQDISKTKSTWWYNHLRHTTTENYDNNWKDWYFLDYMMIVRSVTIVFALLNLAFNGYRGARPCDFYSQAVSQLKWVTWYLAPPLQLYYPISVLRRVLGQ